MLEKTLNLIEVLKDLDAQDTLIEILSDFDARNTRIEVLQTWWLENTTPLTDLDAQDIRA